jgi:hypothetical protein
MGRNGTHAVRCVNLLLGAVELFLAMAVWMLAVMLITLGREFLSSETNLVVSFTCCVLSVIYTSGNSKNSMPFLKAFMHSVCVACAVIFAILSLSTTDRVVSGGY